MKLDISSPGESSPVRQGANGKGCYCNEVSLKKRRCGLHLGLSLLASRAVLLVAQAKGAMKDIGA